MPDLLARFAHVILDRLVAAEAVELAPGGHDDAAAFVAHALRNAEMRSLVTSLESALLRCPEVTEVFCSDEELKRHIDDLDGQWLRR
jgi:hypothetical protein